MARCFVTRELPGPALEQLSTAHDVDVWPERLPPSPAELRARAAHADVLGRMRPTAILINTARGPIVDQAALRQALVEGAIAGAALDVTDPEPLPADDPLLSAPNLIVAPHIGSATRVARERMTELAVENLLAGLEGRPMPRQANAIS